MTQPRSIRGSSLIASIAIVIGGAACSPAVPAASPTPSAGVDAVRISHAGTSWLLHVAVADTEARRATGLMGVRYLPADRGMAFVFPSPTTATFWMKDTVIPLQIAFVADGRILALRDMAPCAADPCPTYDAGGPYTLAVEANAGYFTSRGIADGDAASLEQVDG